MSLAELFLFRPGQPLLFSSGAFLVLFVVFYGIHGLLRTAGTARLAWVLAFSIFFYYKSSGAFVLLLLAAMAMDYWFATQVHRSEGMSRRAWVALSLAMNLGILGYYKYANFAGASFAGLLGRSFEPWSIVMPVGVSFFTFQSLSYTLDVYRKEIKPARSLLDYAFFATFFPQLVAGPIVRARDFLPQIEKPAHLDRAALGRAWALLMAGLFKKAIISDYISLNFVDRVFDAPGSYSGMECLLGAYGYALQIYCDFSGYSDMAIGLALLMGFRLPDNFNAPYLSSSLTEFWRRWHISLSSWLRDYLYIPLGGSRRGRWRTYANLMLTMLLGGLWHGASWRFVAWGGLHGLGLAFERALGLSEGGGRWWRRIITFHLVCLGWVLFRAGDLEVARALLSRLGQGSSWGHLWAWALATPLVACLMVFGYLMHAVPRSWESAIQGRLARCSPWTLAFLMVILILGVAQIRSSAVQPFIYFQF